ncbi:reverse transcriptase domain-containing protein [Tanacetum coccineum]
MLKFLVDGGIVTIRSTILIPVECATMITSSKEIPKEAEVHHEKFKVALHPNFSDQEVSIGGTLSAKGQTELCSLLKKNLDIYAWQPSDMTRVLPSIVYQRLVDKAFDNQVGRNIEVYIDDLVIRGHTEAEMLRDIDEMFRTLRKTNMKLNPKKCTFEAVEGMFLGYMISPEGIKPCPDKTEAVLQLLSPRSIKEVQILNGKLASLNRFLSKSTEKSLQLFKTLKKCIKKSDFHWTPDAEQAFKQLKQHLSELPLLVAPKPKEELIVYMSASHEAISAVLMTERGTILADFLVEKPDESPPDASVVEIPNPQLSLTPITAPWPFYKWGIDIAGPFPEGPGKVKFFIVAMDYFTKWIEVKDVATITGSQVKKFVWDNIVCRFGLSGEIVSDNVKHPHSNGLVERANRSLGEGIKSCLGEGNKNWIEELPHVMWTHRTMFKSSHGDTPFSLTYRTKAVIPAEIGMPTYRTAVVDVAHNDVNYGEIWIY